MPGLYPNWHAVSRTPEQARDLTSQNPYAYEEISSSRIDIDSQELDDLVNERINEELRNPDPSGTSSLRVDRARAGFFLDSRNLTFNNATMNAVAGNSANVTVNIQGGNVQLTVINHPPSGSASASTSVSARVVQHANSNNPNSRRSLFRVNITSAFQTLIANSLIARGCRYDCHRCPDDFP
ncbi:hypothetical protein HGRIS_005451 [Hohenbuehelia grisea]|uniref:Uncharacterized protein n=1 Tax=Hohenbuehelia grisea TaxID=104357 RepID=A0ABR3JWV3_9AGAR